MMYSEKTFENYIFWTKVKRVVLMIVLSLIGAGIGVLLSMVYETAAGNNNLSAVIIAVSTIVMFLISLLFTVNVSREVQDGYWKMAVLRKLTTIQKLLETNNELLGAEKYVSPIPETLKKTKVKKVKKENKELEENL